jgi:hypothetical protein
MALQNAFGDIALDATVQDTNTKLTEIEVLTQQVSDLSNSINTLVQFLYANSPRIDVANRVVSNGSEVTQPVSGTVTATVANATIASGTLTNLTNISGQPQQYQGQDVPIHIYDNIKVT